MKNLGVTYAVVAITAILAVSCQQSIAAFEVLRSAPVAPIDPADDPNLGLSVMTPTELPAATKGGTWRPVRLCRGESAFKFPNVGLCRAGKVYIVIDNNLVYLRKGRYSANAVGSPCSFTIVDNCGVRS